MVRRAIPPHKDSARARFYSKANHCRRSRNRHHRCLEIENGTRIPHKRHWVKLAELGTQLVQVSISCLLKKIQVPRKVRPPYAEVPMQRLIFVMLAAASVLSGTSFTSATCTLGNETITSSSGCFIFFVLPDGTSATIQAVPDVTPLSFAAAGASLSASEAIPFNESSSATARYSQVFTTAGLPRPGIAQLQIFAFGQGGADSQVSIGPYSLSGAGCSLEPCTFGGSSLPFELGVPFTVSLSADAAFAGPEFCLPETCPFGRADISTFSLFEANGSTPVSFTPVPEPSIFGLLLFSLIAFAALHARRRRAGSRHIPVP